MQLDRELPVARLGLCARVLAWTLAFWVLGLTTVATHGRLHAVLHEADADSSEEHHEGCALCLFAHGLIADDDPAPSLLRVAWVVQIAEWIPATAPHFILATQLPGERAPPRSA